jgi:hypothetical protein
MRYTLLIANAPDAWDRPADATAADGVIDDWTPTRGRCTRRASW